MINNAFSEHWTVTRPGGLASGAIAIARLSSNLTDVLVRLQRRDGTTQVERLLPSAPDEMALPLFCYGLVEHLSLQAFFGINRLQSPVFFFQFLYSGHHRDIHAAELRTPLVECGITHAVLPPQRSHRSTGLPSRT